MDGVRGRYLKVPDRHEKERLNAIHETVSEMSSLGHSSLGFSWQGVYARLQQFVFE
jgi:hypothetical protein